MEQRADEAVGGAFFGIFAVCWLVGAVAGYLTMGVVGGLVLGTLVACAVGRQFLQGRRGDEEAES